MTSSIYSYARKERLIGVIYLQSIPNVRVAVLSRNIEVFRKAAGETVARNVVIGTTKWELVTEEEAKKRHNLLCHKLFQTLIAEGAEAMPCRQNEHQRVLDAVIRRHEENISLLIQHEIVISGKKVRETGAGQVLEHDVRQSYKDWAKQNRQQIQELLRDVDNRTPQEIKALERDLRGAAKEKKRELKSKQRALDKKLSSSRNVFTKLGL